MKELLKLLRGAKIIARGTVNGREIIHYLLSDGFRVIEIVR
jgi:hypothetical protein